MADRLQLKYERIQFYMAQGQIESDCHETVDSMGAVNVACEDSQGCKMSCNQTDSRSDDYSCDLISESGTVVSPVTV